jgi:hypothetical protein
MKIYLYNSFYSINAPISRPWSDIFIFGHDYSPPPSFSYRWHRRRANKEEEKGSARPEKGSARPEKGSARPEKGSARPEKGSARPPVSISSPNPEQEKSIE